MNRDMIDRPSCSAEFLDLMFLHTNQNDFKLMQAEFLYSRQLITSSQVEIMRRAASVDTVVSLPDKPTSFESKKFKVAANSARYLSEYYQVTSVPNSSFTVGSAQFTSVLICAATLSQDSSDSRHKLCEFKRALSMKHTSV